VYCQETEREKEVAEVQLKQENTDTQTRENKLQLYARQSLSQMGESDVNHRYKTRKKQYVPSTINYKHGGRGRSSIDRYRHCEGALKKVTP
jgi:hypothetical protein